MSIPNQSFNYGALGNALGSAFGGLYSSTRGQMHMAGMITTGTLPRSLFSGVEGWWGQPYSSYTNAEEDFSYRCQKHIDYLSDFDEWLHKPFTTSLHKMEIGGYLG